MAEERDFRYEVLKTKKLVAEELVDIFVVRCSGYGIRRDVAEFVAMERAFAYKAWLELPEEDREHVLG